VILFWVICAGLLIIALAFILPPLFQSAPETHKGITEHDRTEANIAVYRDQLQELKADLNNGIVSQEQFDQDTEEIEKRLLEDTPKTDKVSMSLPEKGRATAYALALAIPLIAVVFYIQVGSPKGITGPGPQTTGARQMGPENRSAEQIAANVQKLADKLKENPADTEGWIMLGRSYTSMERFGEAAGAYAKATELKPNDADLWAEYAFVTAMAGNRKVEGKSLELVNEALKIDPENAKALQLAGSAAFEAKDYKKAIELWQRVLSRAPADSELGQAITERINEAKSLAGSK
jgi:cytochrome c-type biogenesis protein CcmH